MAESEPRKESLAGQAWNTFKAGVDAVTRDGHLAAAGRQGLDEAAHMLKAFPDSVQEREYGTIFDPYPSDAVKNRDKGNAERTPGQIAASASQNQDNDLGRDGSDRGRGR